jgi:crotonobetainyl-CoA:carnitine CoA-transferase CaiB-like acyl-CoA transferase
VTAALRAERLRVAPVLTVGELFEDRQLRSREFFRALPHPVLGTVQCLSAPFLLSATPSRQERAGPTLGADNDDVFGGILGLGAAEREALARDGVFD